jgi:subtilisin-like proprotein convertase family protein
LHPNDPLYAQQWYLTKLGNIEKVWDEYSGAGVHVGVYDSGIDLGHPELTANYDGGREVVINGAQLSGAVNIAGADPNTAPAHGTLVAGVLGAVANNGEGIVGVAWGSTLTSVNIFDTTSPIYEHSADITGLLAALHQMTNFDVANHSWNDAPIFDPLSNLNGVTGAARVNAEFGFATEHGRNGLGTLIVQASANNNADAQGAGWNVSRYTISVAAFGQDGFAADFSNYGACILVTGPGVAIGTTDLTGAAGYQPNDYVSAQGTSLSTPIVCGIVALMLQANPNLGWRDVQSILAASAKHTGSAIGALTPGTNENSNWFLNDAANWNGGGMHFSNDYGYGAVNAYNAVRMAEMWSKFQIAQTTGNEHNWSTWKWGGGNINTGIAIADNGTTADSVTLLPDTFGIEVEHVDVTIDLKHQHFNDLRIYLTSPEGTEIQLYDGSGASLAPVDTEFTWTFGADALRGERVSGNWQLRIEDAVAGNTGHLYWFEVKAYGKGIASTAAARNDTYHYTDEFLAMKALAGEGGRATLADTGGVDWIDAAAVTGNFALKLGAGLASTVNGVAWFTIAGGTLIENAVTGDGNDALTGNAAGNTLYGMRGNDTLTGLGGSDSLHGGKGDDTYVIDSGLDLVDEYQEDASGIDTVLVPFSFNLASVRVLGDVENLTLTNVAAALSATGNALANVLTGNNFANTLTGAGGLDSLRGGLGNDVYVLENGSDGIVDTGGVDTATSTISRSIASYATVENLTLLNFASALAGTGNNLGNTITGNGFANTLTGGIGNDILGGEAGSDVLIGGVGIDTLSGGASNDFFVFNAPLSAANRDTITDFANVSGNNDAMRLENAVMPNLGAGVHALSAAFFRAGAAAADANDHVIYNRSSGALSYDSNGNLAGGITLLTVLTTRPLLTAADFFVI